MHKGAFCLPKHKQIMTFYTQKTHSRDLDFQIELAMNLNVNENKIDILLFEWQKWGYSEWTTMIWGLISLTDLFI